MFYFSLPSNVNRIVVDLNIVFPDQMVTQLKLSHHTNVTKIDLSLVDKNSCFFLEIFKVDLFKSAAIKEFLLIKLSAPKIY